MVLARPPQRDGEKEPRDPGVEQHIARRQDDADRPGNRNHVTHEDQDIVPFRHMVLQVVDLRRR
jgi:hypothetical protein